MRNVWESRFIHVLLLILFGFLFLLFVISFLPTSLTFGNFIVQGCNVYDLFRAITGSLWGSVLILVIIGSFIVLSWMVIWLKLKNRKILKKLSITTGIVYLVTLVVLLLFARPYFDKSKRGAMQDLIQRDTLYVKVIPLPNTHGCWAYPSISFYAIDSTKHYAFVHYNFNLKGHDNVYVYQKFWSIVHNDTLVIHPYPWLFERRLFFNNVVFYLKGSTRLCFLDKFTMSWFMKRKSDMVSIDTSRWMMYLVQNNGKK